MVIKGLLQAHNRVLKRSNDDSKVVSIYPVNNNRKMI